MSALIPRLPRLNATYWRLLAATCMVALTVPRLWQRGMFVDGMTYAVVARNMALGIGSIWAPSLSDTIYARFFEQPPLGMALQAIAFALVGDHFAVERVFSLLMFGANAVTHRGDPATLPSRSCPLAADPAVARALGGHVGGHQQHAGEHAGGLHEPGVLCLAADERPPARDRPGCLGCACGRLRGSRHIGQGPCRPLPADPANPLPCSSGGEQAQASGARVDRICGSRRGRRWLSCSRRRRRVSPSAHS